MSNYITGRTPKDKETLTTQMSFDALKNAIQQQQNLDYKKILKDNPKLIKMSDVKQFTLLHYAALFTYYTAVAALIEHGANSNKKSTIGETPLHIAAESGHFNIVEALLDAGATVDEKDNDAYISLHFAARYGHLNVVNALLDAGATVDGKTNSGVTALHFAAQYGQLEVVKALLNAGATVDQKTIQGATALHKAVEIGHLDIVHILLNAGATVNNKTNIGMTPLYLAAQSGHLDIAQALLIAKANIDEKTNAGFTALCVAAILQHLEVVKLLLASGGKVEAQTISDISLKMNSQTPLEREKSLTILSLLLEPKHTNATTVVPAALTGTSEQLKVKVNVILEAACEDNNLEVIDYLLDNYLSVLNLEYKSKSYRTVLVIACLKLDKEELQNKIIEKILGECSTENVTENEVKALSLACMTNQLTKIAIFLKFKPSIFVELNKKNPNLVNAATKQLDERKREILSQHISNYNSINSVVNATSPLLLSGGPTSLIKPGNSDENRSATIKYRGRG